MMKKMMAVIGAAAAVVLGIVGLKKLADRHSELQ